MTELSESLIPIYGTLSAATYVLYDHITTYDLEVELVWKRSRWTIVQYLFIINRYVADVFMVYLSVVVPAVLRRHASNGKEVRSWQGIVPGMMAMMLLGSMQGIMALRISSLYDHRRSIKILLVSAILMEISATSIIYAVKNSVQGFENVRYVCTTFYVGPTRGWAFVTFIPFTCFEVLVLVLVVREARRYYQGLPEDNLRGENASLLRVVFRDSILFPSIAIVVCIFCILSYTTHAETPVGEVFAHQGTGVVCLLGPRLILNLRDAYYTSFDEEVEQNKQTRTPVARRANSLTRSIVLPHRDHDASADSDAFSGADDVSRIT